MLVGYSLVGGWVLARRPVRFDESEQYSLRNKLTNQIREDILSGYFAPGESLPEVKLAEEYGVSRTPIREALRQLELEGLVVTAPNRGAVVSDITEQDVMDVYRIREMVEGLAAFRAAEHITPEELEALEELVDLTEFYVQKGDFEKVVKTDTRFHEAILEVSKSKPIKQALGALIHYVQRARLVSLRVPGRLNKFINEHRAILQAIKNRDPEAAAQAVSDHVRNARENLLIHLQEIAKEES